jgi:predicted nucleotidyltransferase component of viral defense system
MSREKKAAQIKKQLANLTKSSKTLLVNELRIILSLERIVARLEKSPELRNKLIFKGGFVLLKVLKSERFTRDLDALCRGIEKEDAQALILDAIQSDLNDGFWFGEIKVQQLDEQGEYGALRFDCAYQIGDPPKEKIKLAKLSRIHFDVGFGDKVLGKLAAVLLPSLLSDAEPLSWKVYPLEFIYSEKLETLVKRGSGNSRSKDIYDMTILFEKCTNTKKLLEAIQTTFKTRQTDVPGSFLGFSKSLNLRQLENSWGSVQLADADAAFEICWRLLQKQFAELDKLVSP